MSRVTSAITCTCMRSVREAIKLNRICWRVREIEYYVLWERDMHVPASHLLI
jgi:hypothetical protein